MPAEYAVITLEEMNEFLEGHGYAWTQHDAWEAIYEKTVRNYIYKMGGFRTIIRVFTSVDLRTSLSRDKGKDAIRVVPLLIPGDNMMSAWKTIEGYPKLKDAYPIRKVRRVHRVTNWRENLGKRLTSAEVVQITKSPMGWPMILRNGRNGLFQTSLGYPMEAYTQTYRD